MRWNVFQQLFFTILVSPRDSIWICRMREQILWEENVRVFFLSLALCFFFSMCLHLAAGQSSKVVQAEILQFFFARWTNFFYRICVFCLFVDSVRMLSLPIFICDSIWITRSRKEWMRKKTNNNNLNGKAIPLKLISQ